MTEFTQEQVHTAIKKEFAKLKEAMGNLHVLHLNLNVEEDSIQEEVYWGISNLQEPVDELGKDIEKLPKE